jgi:peptidyl-tRNA hydrolase
MIFDHIARSKDCGMVRGKIRRTVAHCTVFFFKV